MVLRTFILEEKSYIVLFKLLLILIDGTPSLG